MGLQELASKLGIILVEVDGSGIKTGRTYTDKVSGAVKPLSDSQTAFLWQGSKYPVEVSIDIPQGQAPYRPGFYFLGGPIFAAGDYGRANFKGFRELALVECDLVFDQLSLSNSKPAKAA